MLIRLFRGGSKSEKTENENVSRLRRGAGLLAGGQGLFGRVLFLSLLPHII